MDKKKQKQKQKQKQMYVQVVNLTEGKMYSLPTLYTDRVEACICGQNYVRDRYQENHDAVFYRVLIAKDGKVLEPSYFTVVNEEDEDEDDRPCPHPEQECCEGCPFYSECWDFDDDDDDDDEDGCECPDGQEECSSCPKLLECWEVCEDIFSIIRPND